MAGEWSENRCLDGGLVVRGEHQSRTTLTAVRNTGGGSSTCCHYYPVAAPARVVGDREIQLKLLSRTNFHDMHKPIRNGARVFLADQCTELRYVRSWYSGIGLAQLLGKTVSVTVDISAAACGCAASFTLVPMRQNSDAGTCDGDYYCDPKGTCGVTCAEIALFEANRHAFKVRVHSAIGPTGLENGLGGHHSAFSADDYGPGGALIDTLRRFRVHALLAAGADNELVDIEMNLEQEGRRLSFSLVDASSHHADASASRWYLSSAAAALGQAGLTPVLSYRSAESMEALDAPPCVYDHASARGDEQDNCGEVVHFEDLVLPFEALQPPPAPPSPADPPPIGGDPHTTMPHTISAGLNAREQAWWDHLLSTAFPPPPSPPGPPPGRPPYPRPPPPRWPSMDSRHVWHHQGAPPAQPGYSAAAASTAVLDVFLVVLASVVAAMVIRRSKALQSMLSRLRRRGMRLVGKDDQAVPMATAVDAPEREAAENDPASCDGGVEMPRGARVASES